jgi:DnaJ homolog subfamily C member 7
LILLLQPGKREAGQVNTNASLELIPASHKALRTRMCISMAQEDHQAAVNDIKASLEQVRTEGSQAEQQSLKQVFREAKISLKRSKGRRGGEEAPRYRSALICLCLASGSSRS